MLILAVFIFGACNSTPQETPTFNKYTADTLIENVINFNTNLPPPASTHTLDSITDTVWHWPIYKPTKINQLRYALDAPDSVATYNFFSRNKQLVFIEEQATKHIYMPDGKGKIYRYINKWYFFEAQLAYLEQKQYFGAVSPTGTWSKADSISSHQWTTEAFTDSITNHVTGHLLPLFEEVSNSVK